MATHPLWSDEYWLLLLQLYLQKPAGMKSLYSRSLVELSLELHIPPRSLYEQQFLLRQRETPVLQLIWETYADNPRRLSRDVKKLRSMKGFGQPAEFYEGVEVKETFERDFLPLKQNEALKPVMLIMVLDLYFRLTPITMVEETPEIQELAKLLKISPRLVVEVMDVFQFCDPYLNRDDLMISPLLLPCQEIWNRYGNDNPEKLSALAAQLHDYFR
ncbi:hypothetical protein [Prevotella sp. HUN102]|uniref:hypothetical protein n=1 Tax=Prevotella sp. HUN102 TaxID=1392486 RepID=UPI00048B229E|nr:hypothetical protein [Prevotella sp. HUN102]